MAPQFRPLQVAIFICFAAGVILVSQSANAESPQCEPTDSQCLAESARVTAFASPCTRLPTTRRTRCFREAAIKSLSLGICEDLKNDKQACLEVIVKLAQLLKREGELSDPPEGYRVPRLSLEYYEIRTLASQDKEVQRIVEREHSKIRTALSQNCDQRPRTYNEYIECVAGEAARTDLVYLCSAVFNEKDDDYPVFRCEKLGHPEWCKAPASTHADSYRTCDAIAGYLIQNHATQCLSKTSPDECYAEITATLFRDDGGLNKACSLASDPALCYQRAAARTKNISPCFSLEYDFSKNFKGGFSNNVPVNIKTYEASALKEEVRTCIRGAVPSPPRELMEQEQFMACLKKDPIYRCIVKDSIAHRSTMGCTWYNRELNPPDAIAENHIGANDLAESCIWEIARELDDPAVCLDDPTHPYQCIQGMISLSTSSHVCSGLPEGRDRHRCYVRVPFSLWWIIAVTLWSLPVLCALLAYRLLSYRAGLDMVSLPVIALGYFFAASAVVLWSISFPVMAIFRFLPLAPYYSLLQSLELGELFKFLHLWELTGLFAVHLANILVIAIWISLLKNRRFLTALAMLLVVALASLFGGIAGLYS